MTDDQPPKNKPLKIAYDPIYAHPLAEGHRFPMAKYELIPGQLLYEGNITAENLFSPGLCEDSVVLLTHTREYFDKLKNQTLSPREQRQIGFPQSPALTRRELVITQGTIDCCAHAFTSGVSLNVAGGTHHAFADRGEGFCLLNDFAVAANWLLDQKMARNILIIDLDVHQGNGTASIFSGEPRVFTFSMHGKHNYPFRKERSDLDIELEDGVGDEDYLSLLQDTLPGLLAMDADAGQGSQARKGRDGVKPDFAFFLSGVDILGTDKFGKLKLSMEGCRRRDEFVFRLLRQNGIPCVVAMGGGYSPETRTIVEAHCNTFRTAKEVYGLA